MMDILVIIYPPKSDLNCICVFSVLIRLLIDLLENIRGTDFVVLDASIPLVNRLL